MVLFAGVIRRMEFHKLYARPVQLTVLGVLHLFAISVIMVTILLIIVALLALKIACLVLLRFVTNAVQDTIQLQINALPANLIVLVVLLLSAITEISSFIVAISKIVIFVTLPNAHNVKITFTSIRVFAFLAQIKIV